MRLPNERPNNNRKILPLSQRLANIQQTVTKEAHQSSLIELPIRKRVQSRERYWARFPSKRTDINVGRTQH